MPGSQTRYALDLDDVIAFPDVGHVPIIPASVKNETWYFLVEIISDESIFRPSGNYWMVAFYTDNPAQDVEKLKIKVGTVLALRNAIPKPFLDGNVGFRIEDPSVVEVVPANFSKLREVNAILHCSRCPRCGTRYCSPEHQKGDWSLNKWNLIDWN
ncbi:hypothetical protein DL96DRAFT_1619433 [Flagelloscypha sp. PMI_526]|nr:hypothetical protein DL96DRAFT_1619433 [Flagelloscypha sp. PMI_526]